MRTVLLASLRHNTRRYVASALAVVIGVMFIVVTEGLAGALRSGMTQDVGEPFAGAERVVRVDENGQVDSLLAAAEQQGVAAGPFVQAWESVRVPGGSSGEGPIGLAADAPELRWQVLVEGRHPERPGEALVDERAAAAHDVAVGDTLEVGTGPSGVEVEVVGVAEAAVAVGADLYLTWADLRDRDPYVDVVLWNGSVDAAQKVVEGAEVLTADAYVAELQSALTMGVDVIALLVSVFVAIALGVAVLVIANTFAILFAQRMRDFALLRCVGVTRRQLRRSIRLEALTLGVVSATLGVLLGMVLAHLLAALVGARWDEFGAASFRWWWIAAAAGFGVLVSVVAAWLPTRAATRVSPLAALRPAESFDARSGAGRVRLACGVLLLAVGGFLLAGAVQHSSEDVQLARMFGGGGAFFAGVLLLGPVLVPALVRLTGRLGGRSGRASVVRLAASNATRNPRRTATTAASLMVGVTLTVAMVTGLGVISDTIDVENDQSYPVDAIAVAGTDAGFDEAVTRAVADADEVADHLALPGVAAEVGGVEVPVVGLGEDRSVLHEDVTELDEVDAVLPYAVVSAMPEAQSDRLWNDGVAELVVGGRTRTVRASAADTYGHAVVVDAATLTEWAPDAPTRAIWVRAADGADAGDLEVAVAAATAGTDADLTVDLAQRRWIETQMKVVTGAAIGLLSIGVVIALIGIVNTLGLSVLERTRENALLRAMGLTRTQLKRVLAVEGAMLAGVASLLGVAIGLLFAWVGVRVMVVGMVEPTFSVPLVALLGILVAAVAFGVLASVLPARQAVRVTPAEGLTA